MPKGVWVHVAARFRHDNVTIFLRGQEAMSTKGNRRPGSREEFAVSFALVYLNGDGVGKETKGEVGLEGGGGGVRGEAD